MRFRNTNLTINFQFISKKLSFIDRFSLPDSETHPFLSDKFQKLVYI